jgi:hypothetical protein
MLKIASQRVLAVRIFGKSEPSLGLGAITNVHDKVMQIARAVEVEQFAQACFSNMTGHDLATITAVAALEKRSVLPPKKRPMQ